MTTDSVRHLFPQLFKNGYTPLPNRDKACMTLSLDGWKFSGSNLAHEATDASPSVRRSAGQTASWDERTKRTAR